MSFQPNYEIIGNIAPAVNVNTGTYQPEYVTIDQTYFTASLATTSSYINGGATISSRLHTAQGASVDSATNMTLGDDGNTFSITAVAATINNIISTGWLNGDLITLYFNGTMTLKHNIGGGGGTKVFLAGAVDFSATANDSITLRLINGGWYEVSRTVI